MADAPTLIATLCSSPAEPCLPAATVARLRDGLGRRASLRVLAENEAVAFDLYDGEAREVEAALRAGLGDLPVDVAVLPAARCGRKRLFLADMDSTMIEQECIDELADAVGLKPRVAAITESAMRGEIDFAPALRARVALLQGLPAGIVDEIIARRITLTPGGRVLVATLRAAGAHTCLVSGGFTLFTGPVGRTIGFDEDRANRLLTRDGVLTGEVAEPILGREAKRATLVELRDRLGLDAADVMAVGDGANDLAMLGEAGLGVAFRAKPAVAAVAHARIEHADLTALLYLQGISSDQFVL